MITRADVLARASAADDVLPLLTVDEFFTDNPAEDSLAPNQWGYGRPPLAEVERRLRALAARPDVHWVRVQLHDETFDLDVIAAEAVAICTTLDPAAVEGLLDTNSLQADGVMDGYAMGDPADEPPVPPGSRVLSLVWD